MTDPSGREPGVVYTFYSYKGGVGRSMALANVAALLARWGKRVLVVDWDLEAPGIEKYFNKWIELGPNRPPGVLDLIEGRISGQIVDWRKCRFPVKAENIEQIDVICAGKDLRDKSLENDYVERLRAVDWDYLFERQALGNYLEQLRDEWRTEYDFVLIDSRTGITDIGGICTIHLPDVLVSLFTSNEQSLEGVRDVMARARRGHGRLPVDRRRLLAIPVPARDESGSEYELGEIWRRRFAEALSEFFDDWIPKDERPEIVLDFLKIPYFAYWSFGERLPVLEESDPDNPKTLAYAYQPLARLMLSGLNWGEARKGAQATEAAKEHEARAEAARLEKAKIEEKLTREERAKKQAEVFFDQRLRPSEKYLHFSARRYRKLFALLMSIGILSLLVVLYYSAMLSLMTEFSFIELSFREQLIPIIAGMTTLISIAALILMHPVGRARSAQQFANKLKQLESVFSVSFPADDPQAELAAFVKEVEYIIETADAGRYELLNTATKFRDI